MELSDFLETVLDSSFFPSEPFEFILSVKYFLTNVFRIRSEALKEVAIQKAGSRSFFPSLTDDSWTPPPVIYRV